VTERDRVGPALRETRILVTLPERFARAAADVLGDELAATLAAHGRAALALSGGETPLPVYERLAERSDLRWERVHVYFADERAVPPGDPASNFRGARETLLSRVAIPEGQVHRMEAERADADGAAARYEALLPEALDLLVLGIGSDGHTASLFPGAAALGESRRRVLPTTGPPPHRRRLSITAPVIAAARCVVVLASGSRKADAVVRALEEPGDPRDCPARLARRGTWILDRDAAARLRTVPPAPAPAPAEP
jgi:6-phosphogluconolactonase